MKRSAAVFACGLAAAITLVVFLPSLRNDFVAWDDDSNFLNNPHYRGLGPDPLGWMFTTTHLGPYQPLSWITLGLDYVLWGEARPWGYHLTSIVLHALNAGLLAWLVMLLMRAAAQRRDAPAKPRGVSPWWALAIALLWSLHPLRVEAATWLSERREVLCGTFSLLALVAHLRARPRAITFALAVAAMLSKATAVTLPILFIIHDLWADADRTAPSAGPRPLLLIRRHGWTLAAAAVVAAVAIIGQIRSEAAASLSGVYWYERPMLLGYGLAFYIFKTVWPFGLAPLYEAPPEFRGVMAAGYAGLAAAAVALALAWRWRRRSPECCALLAAYIILVLPVGGLIKVGSQLAADRYAYQPGWMVILLAAVLSRRMLQRGFSGDSARRIAGRLLLIGLAAGLAWRTLTQQAIWRDTESLWTHQLAVAPDTAIAHHKLGLLLLERATGDDWKRAEGHFRAAVAKFPDFAESWGGLGELQRRDGRIADAAQSLAMALRYEPRLLPALSGMAEVLWRMERRDEAFQCLNRLLDTDRETPMPLQLMARALAADHRAAEAAGSYEKAIGRFPSHSGLLAEAASFLATHPDPAIRNGQRALPFARRALELSPDSDEAVEAVAVSLAALGRAAEAIALLEGVSRPATGGGRDRFKSLQSLIARGEPIRSALTFP